MLHMNELLFRHLFQHVDGGTSEPYKFVGDIFKALENGEKWSTVKFPTNLPKLCVEDASADQKY